MPHHFFSWLVSWFWFSSRRLFGFAGEQLFRTHPGDNWGPEESRCVVGRRVGVYGVCALRAFADGLIYYFFFILVTERINLTDNELGGKIPKEIGNLVGVQVLGLGRNEMDGEVPKELGNLVELGEYSIVSWSVMVNINVLVPFFLTHSLTHCDCTPLMNESRHPRSGI